MQQKKKLITACVTIFAAAFTAHLMQRNGAEAARGVPLAQVERVAPVLPQPEVVADDAGERVSPNLEIAETMAPELETPVIEQADAFEPEDTLAETESAIEKVAESNEPVLEAAPQPEIAVVTADTSVSVLPASVIAETPEQLVIRDLAGMPRPPEDALVPTDLAKPGVDLRARITASAAVADSITEQPVRNQFGLTCGIILTASEAEAAMINITLTAPCRGEQPVTISHGALTYSAQMDQLGTYTAQIPALLADGAVEVEFPDGETTGTFVEVAGFESAERVLLQSKGDAGLQIHAREFGAHYGDAGHVWNGATRDPEFAARVGGGFLTVLGNARIGKGHVAEIYTYPKGDGDQDGMVRLSLEAEVTAENCGLKIAGQTQQIGGGAVAQPVTLTLAMPDCDAVGEYLVLKNILRDLRLASNN